MGGKDIKKQILTRFISEKTDNIDSLSVDYIDLK